MTPRALHLAQILWPAFIMAGILEMVVFSMVDPSAMSVGSWQPDVRTTYSLAFFVFWALVSAASGLSHLMMREPTASVSGARRSRRHSRRGVAMQHQP